MSLSAETFEPTPGYVYNVICPTCNCTIEFKCLSHHHAFVDCSSCAVSVDLRDLSSIPASREPLVSRPVRYVSDVELNVGCSDGGTALDQIAAVMKETTDKVHVPKKISFEATEAVFDERDMAMAKNFSCLHPVTHTIEYVLFGSKPYCTMGHCRIFRKKIPFYGYKYFCIPRTSVSYAPLVTMIFFFFLCACYAVYTVGEAWLRTRLAILFVLMSVCYLSIFNVIFQDPGFVLPGYISGDENGGSQIIDRDAAYQYEENKSVIKSIENERRVAQWEVIDGIPMERKWCTQCRIYRPVRAAHCYQCGFCVSVHDHHCVITGGCVGRRNIRSFTWFTLEGVCASAWAGYVTFQCLYHYPEKFSIYVIVFLGLFNVTLSWVVALVTMTLTNSLLLGMVTEVTTRERLQKVYYAKKNPFSRGFVKNIIFNVFRKKHEPSILREEVLSLWVDASRKRENRGVV